MNTPWYQRYSFATYPHIFNLLLLDCLSLEDILDLIAVERTIAEQIHCQLAWPPPLARGWSESLILGRGLGYVLRILKAPVDAPRTRREMAELPRLRQINPVLGVPRHVDVSDEVFNVLRDALRMPGMPLHGDRDLLVSKCYGDGRKETIAAGAGRPRQENQKTLLNDMWKVIL
jgi:hypothetical protein